MNNKAIAQSTIEALERGSYTTSDGTMIDLTPYMQYCVQGTICYTPDELDAMPLPNLPDVTPIRTTFELVNETTLQGCARLSESRKEQLLGVLNFASARNPGGGFLGGAQAQEESLARSSGLYFSLRQCPDFYTFHRAQSSLLYSDRMIYSPQCIVFRNDDGNYLDVPYVVDFITSPAPNAGAIRINEPESTPHIEPVLRERASKVLKLAAHQGCDTLVLGAWGCGVFQNDPAMVASAFYDLLKPDGVHAQWFDHVLFSVYDKSRDQRTFRAFADQFADLL